MFGFTDNVIVGDCGGGGDSSGEIRLQWIDKWVRSK